MLKIRLKRIGRKNLPFYRIVVAQKHLAVKKKYLELLGHYCPRTHRIKLNNDRALFWLQRGAIPSASVKTLLSQQGVLKQFHELRLATKKTVTVN